MEHYLKPLLEPRSIAIVGASPQLDSAGHDALLELRQSGFAGKIYPVNPKYDELEGHRCYHSVDELPESPELTVLAVGNTRLEEQVSLAIRKGTKALVLFGSAHLEEDERPPLHLRIQRLAREAGVALCGANCMGFYNNERQVRVFPQFLPRDLKPGHVTYISQSGSALTALLWNDRKLRFNLAVSSGQELVTNVADYMDYALELESTRVIAIFLESVRDADSFTRALAKANRKRIPIVVLKVGKTEASAALALSHTGAIAGNDAAYQALFDRYGVISVDTLEELAATSGLLSQPRPIAMGGIAAIMDSGGEREMIVDLAEKMNVPFAKISGGTSVKLRSRLDPGLEPVNPLDAWGTGKDYEHVFADCLTALLEDDDSAVGVLVADLTSGFRLHEGFARACRTALSRTQKPIVVLTNHGGTDSHQLAMQLVEGGIPVLDGTVAGLAAIGHALRYRDFISRDADEPPEPVDPQIKRRWRARLMEGQGFDEFEALEMLSDYGIRTQKSAVCESESSALSAARGIGFPVAVKTAMPGILHKSDVGGVRLNVRTEQEFGEVYQHMSQRLGPRVLVAEMVEGSAEIAVGLLHDSQFGQIVMAAAGGTLIELLRDRRVKLAPFGTGAAREMIDQLSCRRILEGMRGAAPCDVDALAHSISRLSQLANDLGDLIQEMDVNPLKVGTAGCVAVDALVTPRAPVVNTFDAPRDAITV